MMLVRSVALVAALGGVLAAPANLTKRASGKAGVSWAIQEPDAAPVKQFFGAGSAVTWWYDWNKGPGWLNGYQGTEGAFIPMCFDTSCLSNGLAWGGGQIMMGFNEPDNAACANVQPGPAAVAWPGIVANARATMPGIKLASPAVMNLGSSWWLQQFFGAICPGGLARCSVAPDYLAVHIYTLDSGDFIGQLQEWNRQFPTLPIIVNEFACTTFGGAIPSQAQVNQFMNDVTTFMDDTPWVVKYAWFGAAANSFDLHGVAEANRLVDQSGTITALGKQYVAGGRL